MSAQFYNSMPSHGAHLSHQTRENEPANTMKNLVLGALLAAVVLFAWGFVFWGLIPNAGVQMHPDEAALQQHLAEGIPETGAYYVPFPAGADDTESMARHEAGPIAFLFIRLEGRPLMPVSTMIGGFLHMLITALLIGMLLRMLLPSLPAWRDRVLFVALAGLAAALWSDFTVPIWWHTPWAFFVWLAVYDIIAWTLAGAVLARFVRPAA